jgi:hypothetical protein
MTDDGTETETYSDDLKLVIAYLLLSYEEDGNA